MPRCWSAANGVDAYKCAGADQDRDDDDDEEEDDDDDDEDEEEEEEEEEWYGCDCCCGGGCDEARSRRVSFIHSAKPAAAEKSRWVHGAAT